MNDQEKFKSLYIFTGKGGVGKTTTSLAFCHYLISQNKPCTYVTLEEIIKNDIDFSSFEHLNFELWESVNLYLEKKFSSKVVAALILKAPFFRALIKMMPGFRYVIFMGHLINKMKSNPEHIYVMDSPSSGHLLTLFESLYHFKDMFGTGSIASDLQDSLDYWVTNKPYKINIIAGPQKTILQETLELKEVLLRNFELESEVYVNFSLTKIKNIEVGDNNPNFLTEKIENEKKCLTEYKDYIQGLIPYSPKLKHELQINELTPNTEQCI